MTEEGMRRFQPGQRDPVAVILPAVPLLATNFAIAAATSVAPGGLKVPRTTTVHGPFADNRGGGGVREGQRSAYQPECRLPTRTSLT
jgi:hypothetical protein